MKKIEIGKNGKVALVWNVSLLDYSKEQEQSIISAFAKKYGIPASNIHVEPNFGTVEKNNDTVLNSENIENIQSPEFQHGLFKQYLDLAGIKDYDFDEILKIDSSINAMIDYDAYEKSKRYTIKWVKWDNFLSYGSGNFFDFTKLQGLVLLKGVPANESGKSTFAYDLLHYLLFGKIQDEKAKTNAQLFNNYLPDATTMTVEGCINIDGQDYIIRRTLTRPAASKKNRTVTSKVEYLRVREDGVTEELKDGENLQAENGIQTSKIIKEALGNEADFDMIISANSKDLDSLISLKDTDRGRLLSRWIGLSVLEDKDAIAREKWNKDISKKRFCDVYNKETLENEIKDLEEENKEYEDAEKAENEKISGAENRINNYQATKQTLIESRRQIDANLTNIDVVTLQAEMDRTVEKGKSVSGQIDQCQQYLDSLGNEEVSEEEYTLARSNGTAYASRMAEIRTEIRNLQSLNKNLASAEYCPTCGRKFENVDNTAKIQENENTIKSLTNEGIELKSKSDANDAYITKMDEVRSVVNERNRTQIKISALTNERMTHRQTYLDLKRTMDDLIRNKAAIEENNRIDASINVVDENIRAEMSIKSTAEYNIASYRATVKSNNEKITEKKTIIARIDDERKTEKNWKTYLQLIGKNGIGKMVLRNTLPIINGELSRLLSDVADFNVEVTINEKNDVEFWLLRDGVRTRLSAASGLERTEAALALRVVLGKMSRLSRPPFILLDEILGTVAKESYDNMKKLYDKVVKSYDFVLHITHLDLEEWHNGVIVVEKVNNISRIKQECLTA